MVHPFLQGNAPPPPGLSRTDVPGLPLFARGKVRDMYDLGDRLLMVATDRLSAFDVVMREPFPGKGIVLTALSEFWFDYTRGVIPNHFISMDLEDLPAEVLQALGAASGSSLAGRSMVVRKAQRIDIECVVRGYLAGSGWAEYRKTGVCIGHTLPAGLVESSQLPEPIFTPSTKAETGHDENISTARMADLVGTDVTRKLEDASLRLYNTAAARCRERGIILADTKFEFGVLDGDIILIDEALTPDSSRFWPADQYQPGGPQPSFDKQFVRDWLTSPASGWSRSSGEAPPPALPADVIDATSRRYLDLFERLTGASLLTAELS